MQQQFAPTPHFDESAGGHVVASQAVRQALASAHSELEVISSSESVGVSEAWQDIELGLVLNHGWSLLGAQVAPDCRLAMRRTACPRLVWTRTADMHLMGDSDAEHFVHAAMEAFARTGSGHIFSMPDGAEFRLHVRDKRVRFAMSGACVRVLGVFGSV